MKYPESLEKLIECFSLYPGIGQKTAERLAFYTLTKMSKEDAVKFSEAINDVLRNVHKCNKCGFITDKDKCDICLDDLRDNEIMVVESSKDVISIENTRQFHGKYHVLDGLISPMKGIGPDNINIDKLVKRVKDDKIEKITLALPATIEGETTALYIKKLLEETGCQVYKIGYGIPVGASLEYIDEITLLKALEGKKEL